MTLRPSIVARNTVSLVKLAYLDDKEENRAELERTLLHSLPLNSKNRNQEGSSFLRKAVNTLGGAAGIYGLYKGIRDLDAGKTGLSLLGLGALGLGNIIAPSLASDFTLYDPEYAAAQKKLDELENNPDTKDYYLDIRSTLDKYDNPDLIRQAIALKDKQLARQPFSTSRTKTSASVGVGDAVKGLLSGIDYKKLGLIAGGGLGIYGGAKLLKHIVNSMPDSYMKFPSYDPERADINRALSSIRRDNKSSYTDILRNITRFDYNAVSDAERAERAKKKLTEEANKYKELSEYRNSELGKSVGRTSELEKELGKSVGRTSELEKEINKLRDDLNRTSGDKALRESDLGKAKSDLDLTRKELESLIAKHKDQDDVFKRRALMALGAATVAGTAGGYAYGKYRNSRNKQNRGMEE